MLTMNPVIGPLIPLSKRLSLFIAGSFWNMTAPNVGMMPGTPGIKYGGVAPMPLALAERR